MRQLPSSRTRPPTVKTTMVARRGYCVAVARRPGTSATARSCASITPPTWPTTIAPTCTRPARGELRQRPSRAEPTVPDATRDPPGHRGCVGEVEGYAAMGPRAPRAASGAPACPCTGARRGSFPSRTSRTSQKGVSTLFPVGAMPRSSGLRPPADALDRHFPVAFVNAEVLDPSVGKGRGPHAAQLDAGVNALPLGAVTTQKRCNRSR